jgi:hypothetical protein
MPEKRACTRCGELLPEEAFPFHKTSHKRLKECAVCRGIRAEYESTGKPLPWAICPGARGEPCGKEIRNRTRDRCALCHRKANRLPRGAPRSASRPKVAKPTDTHPREEYMHRPELMRVKLRN